MCVFYIYFISYLYILIDVYIISIFLCFIYKWVICMHVCIFSLFFCFFEKEKRKEGEGMKANTDT